jgi:predicted nucleic acid-binding protein
MSDLRPIVVDASVAIALVRDEPVASSIGERIRFWAEIGQTLLVPSLFWYEVVNPLARQYRYTSQELLGAVHEIEELTLVTVEPDRPLFLLTIDHIERYGLSAFDAHYLALSTQLGAPIATLDQRLGEAAGSRWIRFDGSHRLSEAQEPYEHDVTWPKYKGAAAYLAKLRAEALRDASTP